MNSKDKNKLIELVKYALDPEDISFLKDSYEKNGNISYLTLFKSKAVVSYFETGEPEAYWGNMRRVGELQIELFKRYEAGEKISSESVGISAIAEISESLSGGCFDLMPEFCHYLKKIKEEKNFFVFILMRHCLCKTNIEDDILKARTHYQRKKRKWFIELTEVFSSLYYRKEKEFEENLYNLMKLYKSNYKYEVPEYKLIAIFPLGLLQLARHYGMDVSIDHELIPKDLLLPVNKNI